LLGLLSGRPAATTLEISGDAKIEATVLAARVAF
jgi:hypothetical protein